MHVSDRFPILELIKTSLRLVIETDPGSDLTAITGQAEKEKKAPTRRCRRSYLRSQTSTDGLPWMEIPASRDIAAHASSSCSAKIFGPEGEVCTREPFFRDHELHHESIISNRRQESRWRTNLPTLDSLSGRANNKISACKRLRSC